MPASGAPIAWSAADAGRYIRVPGPRDDKYSHGVLGVITGSVAYPGAAVLSVEAAGRTGIGMIRYLGPTEASRLVLERRPEVVVQPGRVDAYVIGSGIDPDELEHDEQRRSHIETAVSSGVPVVLDAGALSFASAHHGPTVITPHHRELQRIFATAGRDVALSDIESDPGSWAAQAADAWNVTVLLKGAVTHICSPQAGSTERFHTCVASTTNWMATAGTGDVLAGICGAMLATHATEIVADPSLLGPLAATAAFIHAEAGERVSSGGPVLALDVAEALPALIASLL